MLRSQARLTIISSPRCRFPKATQRSMTSFSKEGVPSKPKVDSMSQGHAALDKNKQDGNIQNEFVKSGKQRHGEGSGKLDAASTEPQTKAKRVGKGNPEGVGMVDQVGSASGSAKSFEKQEGSKKS